MKQFTYIAQEANLRFFSKLVFGSLFFLSISCGSNNEQTSKLNSSDFTEKEPSSISCSDLKLYHGCNSLSAKSLIKQGFCLDTCLNTITKEKEPEHISCKDLKLYHHCDSLTAISLIKQGFCHDTCPTKAITVEKEPRWISCSDLKKFHNCNSLAAKKLLARGSALLLAQQIN